MKKVLLGTSAIALAGAFATPADAAEWTVRVGGYMEQYTGYADTDADFVTGNDNQFIGFDGGVNGDGVITFQNGRFNSLSRDSSGDFDGVDVKSDSEIHFLPKITLDNGMEFGAVIELEGNTSGDQIDESYMRIQGSFGEINLGSENSAGYKMTYAAPNVTFIGTNSGSLTAFFPLLAEGAGDDYFRGTLGSSFLEVGLNNDAHRMTYYTPRFAGFQVGVSYARDGRDDSNTQVDTNGELHDIFDIGANYVNSFGGFNVALSGRYGIGDIPGQSGDPEVWSAGLNLGYGGFTVGGSYADADGDHGLAQGEYWDAGVSYETGPWGFSFTYARGENVDDDCYGTAINEFGFPVAGVAPGTNAPVNNCAGDTDERLEQYMVGVNYRMAQGVDLGVFGAYVDFDGAELTSIDEGPGPGADDSGSTDIEGWVVGTGVKISF